MASEEDDSQLLSPEVPRKSRQRGRTPSAGRPGRSASKSPARQPRSVSKSPAREAQSRAKSTAKSPSQARSRSAAKAGRARAAGVLSDYEDDEDAEVEVTAARTPAKKSVRSRSSRTATAREAINGGQEDEEDQADGSVKPAPGRGKPVIKAELPPAARNEARRSLAMVLLLLVFLIVLGFFGTLRETPEFVTRFMDGARGPHLIRPITAEELAQE